MFLFSPALRFHGVSRNLILFGILTMLLKPVEVGQWVSTHELKKREDVHAPHGHVSQKSVSQAGNHGSFK